MASPIFVIDIGPDGIIATHPQRLELPTLVAPILEEQLPTKFNTLRPHLVAIGCLKLPHSGFGFDSSIVAPTAAIAFTKFADLMQRLKAQDTQGRFPPCSIFGHADPTGSDDYNKPLSGRRAQAVYAVLTRTVSIWDHLFASPFGGDDWGTQGIQTMLSTSLKPSLVPPEPPFYTGPIDGAKTNQTKTDTNNAVADYLESRTGVRTFWMTPAQRSVLIKEYMDAICRDSKGDEFQLDPTTDFLARHKDKDGLKGDVQGCGEFNPIFLLSAEEEAAALKDKDAEQTRNDAYVVDRRVVVYIFEHGTEVDPAKWPCPRTTEGTGGCKLRFWSDATKRRAAGPDERTFGEQMAILSVGADGAIAAEPVENTGNTMACRFYHGFAYNSPCEAKLKEWVVRFRVDAAAGEQQAVAGRRYVVHAGEAQYAPIMRGTTDDNGELRIPVLDEHTKMTLFLDAFGDPVDPDGDAPVDKDKPSSSNKDGQKGFDSDRFPDEDSFIPFVLDGGALHERDVSDDLGIHQRLYNLGFGENAPDKWTPEEADEAFKAYRHRHNFDNLADAAVREKIQNEHDLDDPALKPAGQDDDTAPPPSSSSGGSGGGGGGGGGDDEEEG